MGNHIRLFGVDIPVPSQSMRQPKHIRLFGVDIPVDTDAANSAVVPVYDPVPLQCYPPERKRKRDNKRRDDEEPARTIPPELLQKIEMNAEPTFLYQKSLEYSDVLKGQNRLFVTNREEFDKFLDDRERAILRDPNTKGLEEIDCVDAEGESYKLSLKIWRSMKMLVIKSEWYKLVAQNNAKPGDWVQIWGYRHMGNLRLAINFKKAVKSDSDIPSSSSSNDTEKKARETNFDPSSSSSNDQKPHEQILRLGV